MNAGRALFALALLGFLAGAALLGALLAQQAAAGGIAAVDARLEAWRPWFPVGRLVSLAVIVGGWPYWTAGAARRWQWPAARTAAVAALRWRVLGWLLLVEAGLVQGGLGRLLRGLVG
jgi:hypothetical protein